jgi:Fe-S cluster assembly protein SufD
MGNLSQLRKDAWNAFEQAGLPTTRQEEWKYTSLARIGSTLGETWWTAAAPSALVEADLEALAIPELDAWRIVFADGRLIRKASNLPDGASLTPLSELLTGNTEQAATALGWDNAAPLFNGAVAANSALAEDGLCLRLADGIRLDRPVYVLHIASNPGASHLRHGLWLGRESSAHIIEHYSGMNEEPGLTHVVTLVHLDEAAELRHDRLQDESLKQFHLGRLEVTQGRDSRFDSHAIALGASISRLDIAVDLAGPGAACRLNGLYMPTGRQHCDHHTQIDHHAAHCTSREHYRGVLDGRAHGVFNGKVVVHTGASGTDSAQNNANLLLSDKAEIDAKPELVIHHDDVKAAHGCTVGQLDTRQLFYLKSRGVSDEQARQMLTFAFADEVLADIRIPALRRFVEKAAFSKLPLDLDVEAVLG